MCIPKGARWTDGACLNCWFTGTSKKCSLRRGKHVPCRDSSTSLTAAEQERAAKESRRPRPGIPTNLPDGQEKHAHPGDLNEWLLWIQQEQLDRGLRKRRLGGGD